jgi:hypothetical protein
MRTTNSLFGSAYSKRYLGVALVGILATASLSLLVASAGVASTSGPPMGTGATVSEIGPTIPPNGDVNPYGVAIVAQSRGHEVAGDVLVSNFNSGPGASGLQGRGTTIVELNPNAAPDATPRVFARIDPGNLPGPCPGGIGLTTALSILPGGWVVVGSLPTSDGSTITGAGCLLVLNSAGQAVETFSGGPINGPWDMTASSSGDVSELFFTNVLNGTVQAAGAVVNEGTVVKAVLLMSSDGPPKLLSTTVIASGFPEELNSAALVIGPTGVALGQNGTLYVADTINNRITAVSDAALRVHSAGVGTPISTGGDLNAPLGLATTPEGTLLAANGGDGNLVELTASGAQVGELAISPGGGGALFGLAVSGSGRSVYFVDDSENQLNVLH